MRTPIVAGNWKMNTSRESSVELARNLVESIAGIDQVERILIPPFPWIVPVQEIISGTDLQLGAQNCYPEPDGAFTGEVSATMLVDLCRYVLAGHSERRHVLGESDEFVGQKVAAILDAGLRPILCVGETIEQRERGDAANVVTRQLKVGLQGIDVKQIGDVVIAYEPVWAIGTGHAASPDDAQEMCESIRHRLASEANDEIAGRVRVLYGGSVKASNAAQYLHCPDVDGALVGGASLNADEFAQIVRAAT